MMKRLPLLLFLLISPFCYSQSVILPSIATPGNTSIGGINGAVLGENLFGPRTILFSGNLMNLERAETGSGKVALGNDKLTTLYSGRIFSPGIMEPFIFTNKTPEELVLIQGLVLPLRLEQPYTLYLDLEVKTSTKSISASPSLSDDAGIYNAQVNISIGTLDGNN